MLIHPIERRPVPDGRRRHAAAPCGLTPRTAAIAPPHSSRRAPGGTASDNCPGASPNTVRPLPSPWRTGFPYRGAGGWRGQLHDYTSLQAQRTGTARAKYIAAPRGPELVVPCRSGLIAPRDLPRIDCAAPPGISGHSAPVSRGRQDGRGQSRPALHRAGAAPRGARNRRVRRGQSRPAVNRQCGAPPDASWSSRRASRLERIVRKGTGSGPHNTRAVGGREWRGHCREPPRDGPRQCRRETGAGGFPVAGDARATRRRTGRPAPRRARQADQAR